MYFRIYKTEFPKDGLKLKRKTVNGKDYVMGFQIVEQPLIASMLTGMEKACI
jgi:hypothetical protein